MFVGYRADFLRALGTPMNAAIHRAGMDGNVSKRKLSLRHLTQDHLQQPLCLIVLWIAGGNRFKDLARFR